MVIAAGEEMAEFVDEKNTKKGQGERKTRGERGGMAIEESEVVEKFIDGGGLAAGKGDGELCAGD